MRSHSSPSPLYFVLLTAVTATPGAHPAARALLACRSGQRPAGRGGERPLKSGLGAPLGWGCSRARPLGSARYCGLGTLALREG